MKLKIVQDNSACGLGSTILRVIHNLQYIQNDDLLYFEMRNLLYSSKGNTWNKFFHQPFEDKKNEIEYLFNKGEYEIRTRWYKCGNFVLDYTKDQNKDQFLDREFVDSIRKITRKYLKIKKEISGIGNFFVKNNYGMQNVLSIHKRGTDHFVTGGHAAGQKYLMDYKAVIKPAIEKALKENKCDKIFLATDEQETYDNVKNDFGSIVLKYNTELMPTGSDGGLHYSNAYSDDAKKYKLGVDMLTDVIIMASCKYSLCMRSNVSFLNILLRDNYNYEFIDNHIDYGRWY
jgi:hypothetical protein